MRRDRFAFLLAPVALVMASASFALSAYLFAHQHDAAVAGCQRQNALRRELNKTLRDFGQRPRFGSTDCAKAYRLIAPTQTEGK